MLGHRNAGARLERGQGTARDDAGHGDEHAAARALEMIVMRDRWLEASAPVIELELADGVFGKEAGGGAEHGRKIGRRAGAGEVFLQLFEPSGMAAVPRHQRGDRGGDARGTGHGFNLDAGAP
jgi:hypothetical protein